MQKAAKVARKFAAEKAAREKASNVVETMIGAGTASPAPPLGPLLGQKGLNVASFCKVLRTLCLIIFLLLLVRSNSAWSILLANSCKNCD